MTVAATPSAPWGASRRLANIVRLHLANPFNVLGMPLIILAVIFVANWVIWALVAYGTAGDADAVANASEGLQWSGASTWIFVYMLVVAVLAMNNTFPLALGFGATRRDFYLGSMIAFALLSAFFTLVYTALTAIESATGGWGVNGTMFGSLYFGTPGTPLAARAFHVFSTFAFFFFVGTAIAAIFVRYRQRGLLAFFAILALALVGGAAALTLTGAWPAVGGLFAALGFTGSYALALGIGLLAALAGWRIMRRATPRS